MIGTACNNIDSETECSPLYEQSDDEPDSDSEEEGTRGRGAIGIISQLSTCNSI